MAKAHVLSATCGRPQWIPEESILKNIGFPMTVDGAGNSVSRDIVMKEFDATASSVFGFSRFLGLSISGSIQKWIGIWFLNDLVISISGDIQ